MGWVVITYLEKGADRGREKKDRSRQIGYQRKEVEMCSYQSLMVASRLPTFLNKELASIVII